MHHYSVTLLVMTLNEEKNLARCLDSVPFAEEKIVIDSGSSDSTCEIAMHCGAKVIHQDWQGFGPQRNFGTRQAKHDWILFLDADETLSPELVKEFDLRLPKLMASNLAGAFLPRSATYMGKPMRWYRPMVGESMGRFYHRERAHWTNTLVHESLVFDGPATHFKASFLHHHSPTLVHKQLKVLKYSELKALEWLEKNKPIRLWNTPFIFIASFLQDYIVRLAFLDGWRGLIVSYIAANYALYKRFRHYELNRNPSSRQSAADVLSRHGIRL
jgi:glycosyltransferase involved in cell wall biosynthesis